MQHQVHHDLMKFVRYYLRIVLCSGIRIFFQITLTHMFIIVAKHVHIWIILQCPMFCESLLLTAAPIRMLHAQVTERLQLH